MRHTQNSGASGRLALKIAIHKVGGMGALSRKLGISYQTIQYWLEAGVSDKWLVEVERVTKMPRERLRPDLFKGVTITRTEQREPA
jgi:DNA-binding transcriptional regulator YdaS (Cro superfamily)